MPKEKKEEPVKEEQVLAKVEEQTIKAVEQFLKDTLKAMDMDVEITSSIDEDGALYVDMKGEHMGILIGKRGQTLDALQYLANRVANKHQSGYVRVKLDTENYRARREETLKHLAKNIAHKIAHFLSKQSKILGLRPSKTLRFDSEADFFGKFVPKKPKNKVIWR